MQDSSDSSPTTRAGVVAAPRSRRVADGLIDALAETGVEVVFGLPGGAIAPLHDALLDRPDLRVVTTRHEAGAVFAAAGYARMTGKLGVVLVTSGPGLLNALTWVASALCDGVPVLVLAGETPRSVHGRGALQEGSSYGLRIVEVCRHLSKLACEVPSGRTAHSLLRRAMATALSGRRGPVVLTLPYDVSMAKVESTRSEVTARTGFSLEEAALAPVVDLMATASRPVIFAGSGVRVGAGALRLRELADHLQVPVMTTPKAKGVFPESHPLSLGIFGLGGHPSAARYLEGGVDVLLAIGTSLGDVATDGWSTLLRPKRAFIQVDIEAAQLGRAYPVDVALATPAELFLEKLRLGTAPRPAARRFGVTTLDDPRVVRHGPDGHIAPQRAIYELQRAVGEDAIFCIDSGEHYLYAAHYLRLDRADAFLAMSGLGAMGSSLGAAIGAQLAHPLRPVVVIIGDGGFAMCGSELATASQLGLPIIVCVIDDARLTMCELGHETVFGRRPEYPINLDVPTFALANGAATAVVTAADELEPALRARPKNGPFVLDVRIDRSVRMPKRDRVAAFANRLD